MENQNTNQNEVTAPAPMAAPAPIAPPAPVMKNNGVKIDDAFETIQKLLMVFIFILTVSMFSYWGYQSVMYILSMSYGVASVYTVYDMLIGAIAMIASVALFTGSFMWWRKNVSAEKFLMFGTIGFVLKDILEIPNALAPLSKLAVVTIDDLGVAASAIGYDLFKIGFWVLAMYIFKYAIRKHKEALAK
jgi:hypothetical protein